MRTLIKKILSVFMTLTIIIGLFHSGTYFVSAKNPTNLEETQAQIQASVEAEMLSPSDSKSKSGDDGNTNWDFTEPVTHKTTVPDSYTAIYTPEDLDGVRNNLNGNYILMNDLDLSEWGDWTPIGNGAYNYISISSSEQFYEMISTYKILYTLSGLGYTATTSYNSSYSTYYYRGAYFGNFDGNGYTVKNMNVNIESSGHYAYAGLFGCAVGTKITNLGMIDGDVSASAKTKSYAGTIVGDFIGYTNAINNCYNTGNVQSKSDENTYAGGLVGNYYLSGNNDEYSILNCYNEGKITSNNLSDPSGFHIYQYAGGIAAYSSQASIAFCYNTGEISSQLSPESSYVGGISGYANNIDNCYNMGQVNSESKQEIYAGGIAGMAFGVKNCFNTAQINLSSFFITTASGIVGEIEGNMENCYNTGDINSFFLRPPSGSIKVISSYIGGIFGSLRLPSSNNICIKNCYNTGDTVFLALNEIDENIHVYAGGIGGDVVAYNSNNQCSLINCYNVGEIVNDVEITYTNYYEAGLIGRAYFLKTPDDASFIENCYYLNDKDRAVGSTLSNNISFQLIGVKAVSKTGFKKQDSYVGFDFDEIWKMEKDGYAHLCSLPSNYGRGFIDPIAHKTNVNNGYIPIYTPEDLDNVRDDLFGNYMLMNDIDLSSWGDWEPIGNQAYNPVDISSSAQFDELLERYGALYRLSSGTSYTPVTSYISGYNTYYFRNAYYGTFDGNGYKIKNLMIDINSTTTVYAGLFGFVAMAEVKNLGMIGSNLSAKTSHSTCYLGMIGYAYQSKITNCYNKCDMSASSSASSADVRVGGIAGFASNVVNDCYNTGKISASASGVYSKIYAGGVVGSSSAGMNGCFNTAEISATAAFNSSSASAGGITGSNSSYSPTNNCYNTGKVSSSAASFSYAGGIIGSYSSYYSSISNSYNMGEIFSYSSGNYSRAGGIAGYASSPISKCYNIGLVSSSAGSSSNIQSGAISGFSGSPISDCYYLNNIDKATSSIITQTNVLEKTDAQLKQQSTYAEFDFDEVWEIDSGINDGYAHLQWLPTYDMAIVIIPVENSGAVVDYESKIITGLSVGLKTLDNYVEPSHISADLEYEFSAACIGSGALVHLMKNGKVLETYTVIIFGDVNGDGWYDGRDAFIVDCLAYGLLAREQVGEAVYMAADCNHDGMINDFDVGLLNQAGLLLVAIDQTKTSAELESDSEYMSYIELIDQAPKTDTQAGDNPAGIGTGQSLFQMIINLINSLIKTIFPYLFVR